MADSTLSGSVGTQAPMKRNVAFKLRVGMILDGTPEIVDERLKHVKVGNEEVVRVNLIANIIDKFVQEGEKKFGSLTLDDGTGQIRAKVFGDDVDRFSDLQQGDTVLVIGMVRSWNNEVYLTPEIIKKKEPAFLLLRKLEVEADMPKQMEKQEVAELKEKMLQMIKDAEKDGGVDVDKLILELKESPEVINSEIKKLLEDGVAYEPRPGKLRYLG